MLNTWSARDPGWGAAGPLEREDNQTTRHWIEHALSCLTARWRIFAHLLLVLEGAGKYQMCHKRVTSSGISLDAFFLAEDPQRHQAKTNESV